MAAEPPVGAAASRYRVRLKHMDVRECGTNWPPRLSCHWRACPELTAGTNVIARSIGFGLPGLAADTLAFNPKLSLQDNLNNAVEVRGRPF